MRKVSRPHPQMPRRGFPVGTLVTTKALLSVKGQAAGKVNWFAEHAIVSLYLGFHVSLSLFLIFLTAPEVVWCQRPRSRGPRNRAHWIWWRLRRSLHGRHFIKIRKLRELIDQSSDSFLEIMNSFRNTGGPFKFLEKLPQSPARMTSWNNFETGNYFWWYIKWKPHNINLFRKSPSPQKISGLNGKSRER